MDQIKIGKYIQQLRKTKGLTQKQLAEQLNISFQAVSKWELGETLPDTSIILQLCEILETNVDMLLHGGTYFAHNRKLIRIKDVDNGLKAIEDVKKYIIEKCGKQNNDINNISVILNRLKIKGILLK